MTENGRPVEADDLGPGEFFMMPKALVSGGHLAKLPHAAVAVYVALRCARNHESKLAERTLGALAKEVGLHKGNVSRGIRVLQDAGLIVAQEKPDPQKATPYRLPKPSPSCASATPDKPPTVAPAQRNGCASASTGLRQRSHNKKYLQEDSTTRAGFAAAAAAEPVEGDGEKNGEAIRDLLRQAGIGNPKRDELAALSHLTVERIAAVIAEAEGRPEQKRPGYIIRRLEGTQDRIESPIEKILTTLDCEPQPPQPIKPPPPDPAIAILKAEGERWARANALIDKMKVEQPEKFSRTVAEAFAKLIPVLQAKYRPDPFQSKQFRAELFAIVERETHCGVGLPAPAKQLEVACG